MAHHPELFIYNNHFSTKGSKDLYLNSSTADVFFVFPVEGKQLAAHRYVLAALSPEFDGIFQAARKETDNTTNVTYIEVMDMTSIVFEEFLQFFYFETVKLSTKNLTTVMCLCKQFFLAVDLNTFLQKYLVTYNEFSTVPALKNGSPTKTPPDTNLNESTNLLVCDRRDFNLMSNSYNCRYVVRRKVDGTMFSSNRTILMNSFHCSEVLSKNVNGTQVNVVDDIPAIFKILEVGSGNIIEDRGCICEGEIALSAQHETIIELDTPILIKPNIRYAIIIEFDRYNSDELFNLQIHKENVRFGEDISIDFHIGYRRGIGGLALFTPEYGLVTRIDFENADEEN